MIPSMNKKRSLKGYLFIGVINTIAGYFIGVGIYSALKDQFDILTLGIITNIITIGISYLNYKFFYFGKSDNLIYEILKFYSGYLFASVITVTLYALMLKAGINIWMVQLILILVSFSITYITNNKFVFKGKSK